MLSIHYSKISVTTERRSILVYVKWNDTTMVGQEIINCVLKAIIKCGCVFFSSPVYLIYLGYTNKVHGICEKCNNSMKMIKWCEVLWSWQGVWWSLLVVVTGGGTWW